MALTSDLISQFVKITKDDKKVKNETTVYGTVVYDGKPYVKFDGSDLLTPISTTTNVKDGDRVTVMIKDHTATVTGNISSPSARTEEVEEIAGQVSEFGTVAAHKVTTDDFQATNAYINTLITITGKYEELSAVTADIETLRADYIEGETLNVKEIEAITAKIESIEAEFGDFTNISAEDLEAINAEITKLKAYTADFTYISAVQADVKYLNAEKMSVKDADIKYVNIDFANIDQAWFEELYAKSGLINYVVAEDLTVTGYLVGVTIKGDLIEGGTVVADKLVIKGNDGLYYKLNTNGERVGTEQTEYNSLNGSIITAKSITAEKVQITDLVAFGATIGGFKITDNSIYSGVKSSALNTTKGVYLDNNGQFSLGDANQFLRYYLYEEAVAVISENSLVVTETTPGTFNAFVDEGILRVTVSESYTPSIKTEIIGNKLSVNNDAYKLEISAESILFGANSKKTAADLKALTEYVKIETTVDEETGDQKPCIELSEEDSTSKQVITNIKNTFVKDGNVATEVGANGVKTTDLNVSGSTTHNGFVWASRTNGNYGLSWKEVTN